jgi:hypothetical protein
MGDYEQGFGRHGSGLGPRLGQGVPLIGVAAIAAFNGTLFSPVFDSIFYYVDTFARGSLFYSPRLYLNLTSVFISLMTLLIAGIPAALYERIRGLKASTPVSLGIWLVAAVLLSLPTIMRVVNGDELN